MTRKTIRWASGALMIATAIAYAACVGPGTTTNFGFAVGVADAPPPPPVVVAEPAVVPVAGGVYVVSEPSVRYDLFRYGATWYAYSGGYWYQAPSYSGPFVAVDVRYVPRPVLTVPPRHWRNHPHGGPPGLARGHGDHED
jgi:hypothetical protein